MIIKQRVIITTKSDRSFRGILWKLGWRLLVLKQVELLRPGGEAVQMDGETVIFRADVDFIQVLK